MRHGRIRRWWWGWRLRAAERRLHRARAKFAAFEQYPHSKRHSDGERSWVTAPGQIKKNMEGRIHMATHAVTMYRNLLAEMPTMQLIDGGKEDVG